MKKNSRKARAFSPFDNLTQAMNISLMWGETMAASAYVLTKRANILYGAAENPVNADMTEIGRMIPEKMQAFGKGFADMGKASSPMDAAARLLKPVHATATANAKRLRRG
ncbi:hypothetical protein KCG44_04365 [Pacificimonas sp. WHA3]|uniref:Antifreeze protein n=1 Tax=Pacificimonas pallii TaxID=2827236 RepID=A0ABS6SCD0_9SPHN|nr:hypothetical protein [Pacificimonas pallii]MBV7256015.1 hypothetical protein [Pacificimonas pallii]